MLSRTRFVILWSLSAGVVTVSLAQIVAPPRLEQLEVAIWPEYDQPAALVMYRGWLAPDTPLPTTVTLPIPAAVTAPSAVAKRGPATELLVAPYTLVPEGEWRMVHLQTDLPEVRVEYYATLSTTDPERRFTFEWPGSVEITNLSYEVMQPLGASNFAVTPSSAAPVQGADGLIYQREELGPVPAGGTFFIEVSYSKSTPNLTASALQPVAPPPQAQTTPGAVPMPAPAPTPVVETGSSRESVWIVVLPIVFAAGLAAGWILLSGRQRKSD